MGVALLAAKKSSVPHAQGACVVNKNKRIVSVGYKKPIILSGEIPNEECHAEMVCVLNEINVPLAGCDIYLTHFPCNHCTKLLIQAGIKRVVYISEEVLTADEKQDINISNTLFFEAKVDVQKYCSEKLVLKFDYNEIHTRHEDLGNTKKDISQSENAQDDQFFMDIALLSAQRSKDPSTQVGACVVKENGMIVATGYNGMPNGCSDDKFPWARNSGLPREKTKRPYVCDAEINAIINKNCTSLKNCTIYVLLFPCDDCAKMIIQSGIKKVCYFSDKHAERNGTKRSKNMLVSANVEHEEFTPKRLCLEIDYSDKFTATTHRNGQRQ